MRPGKLSPQTWAARAAPTSLSGLESVLQQCCEQEVMGACRVGGFFPESPATWAPVSFTADERFIANGTNAQRHRFYHIHQHGRTSSRLTDMIRASFRRVNVSGVDDKEPAASEEPVTAQPAARRQLTWRASAPGDYGTIE